jgi:hypothetical protein
LRGVKIFIESFGEPGRLGMRAFLEKLLLPNDKNALLVRVKNWLS